MFELITLLQFAAKKLSTLNNLSRTQRKRELLQVPGSVAGYMPIGISMLLRMKFLVSLVVNLNIKGKIA
jgi:hypothetical protein